jgi:GNAT superfamily N-acetyltransferase
MSPALLDHFVYAKPYFDPEGLIVALADDRPVGFVHAGFGPSQTGRWISTEIGVVCLLMARPNCQYAEIEPELLTRAEDYLRQRGAKVLCGGGTRPLIPFYQGIYGGSELPGVLEYDARLRDLFRARGYREADHRLVYQVNLAKFRPIVDQRQLAIGRNTVVEVILDAPTRTWWDACTLGELERTEYRLNARPAGPTLATVTTWNMEPLAAGWGVRAVGLMDLEVVGPYRRQRRATYLMCETLRQLQAQGVALAELQISAADAVSKALFERLGFQQVDQGVVFRKD